MFLLFYACTTDSNHKNLINIWIQEGEGEGEDVQNDDVFGLFAYIYISDNYFFIIIIETNFCILTSVMKCNGINMYLSLEE